MKFLQMNQEINKELLNREKLKLCLSQDNICLFKIFFRILFSVSFRVNISFFIYIYIGYLDRIIIV